MSRFHCEMYMISIVLFDPHPMASILSTCKNKFRVGVLFLWIEKQALEFYTSTK